VVLTNFDNWISPSKRPNCTRKSTNSVKTNKIITKIQQQEKSHMKRVFFNVLHPVRDIVGYYILQKAFGRKHNSRKYGSEKFKDPINLNNFTP
jgi:hypothetical protein